MRSRTDDEGSTMIIAIIVLMVLSLVTITIQARTLSTLGFIRHAQDFDAALAAADAALAKAVYEIENGRTTTWEEAGSTSGGSARWRFHAVPSGDPTNPQEFVVSAKGRVGEATHSLQAKVTRDALFPYAVFGFQNVRVNGSTAGASTQFYNVGVGVGEPVRVGSNGMITCNGGQAANLRFRSVGGFSGCPAGQWQQMNSPEPRIPLEPPPAGALACPTGGIFSGFVDGHNGTPYVCRANVRFSGTVNVINGPLKVYILNAIRPDGTRDPNTCHSLNIDALVNVGAPARNVQLYKDDDCPLDVGTGNTSSQITFSGVLYAPDSTITINGGKWFTGSIMVGQFRMNGSPNLIVGYDSDLRTYYGLTWRVSRYGTAPSASVTFPSGAEP